MSTNHGSKIYIEIPHAYYNALRQIANHTKNTIEDIVTESIDLWCQKNAPSHSQLGQNLNTLVNHLQFGIIPTGNYYGILFEDNHDYWLDNKPYGTMDLAQSKINEYCTLGHINLRSWSALIGEYPLVILQKNGGVPHIWLGQDSACKLWSTSGMSHKKYKLTTRLPEQNLCPMCVTNYMKHKSPKVHLIFDTKKHLIKAAIQCKDPMF